VKAFCRKRLVSRSAPSVPTRKGLFSLPLHIVLRNRLFYTCLLTNPATSAIIIARLFYQAIPRVHRLHPTRGAEERRPRPIPHHIETGEESGWDRRTEWLRQENRVVGTGEQSGRDRRTEWLFPKFFYSTTPAGRDGLLVI